MSNIWETNTKDQLKVKSSAIESPHIKPKPRLFHHHMIESLHRKPKPRLFHQHMIVSCQGSEGAEKSSPWRSAIAAKHRSCKNPSKDRLSAHFSAHTGTPVPEGHFWKERLVAGRGEDHRGQLAWRGQRGGNRAGFCSHWVLVAIAKVAGLDCKLSLRRSELHALYRRLFNESHNCISLERRCIH